MEAVRRRDRAESPSRFSAAFRAAHPALPTRLSSPLRLFRNIIQLRPARPTRTGSRYDRETRDTRPLRAQYVARGVAMATQSYLCRGEADREGETGSYDRACRFAIFAKLFSYGRYDRDIEFYRVVHVTRGCAPQARVSPHFPARYNSPSAPQRYTEMSGLFPAIIRRDGDDPTSQLSVIPRLSASANDTSRRLIAFNP